MSVRDARTGQARLTRTFRPPIPGPRPDQQALTPRLLRSGPAPYFNQDLPDYGPEKMAGEVFTDGIWFPDGSYYALGHWDQTSLLGQLRHSILKSLVARGCLRPETANLLESWALERSGFSAFIGDPINQPGDRPRLQRVLNYILRPALPLNHLSYVESTGKARSSPPRAAPKVWEHAYDFLRTLASACRLGCSISPVLGARKQAL